MIRRILARIGARFGAWLRRPDAAERARQQALALAIDEARAALARFDLAKRIKPTGLLALKREIEAAPADARIAEENSQVRIYFADGRQMRCGEKFMTRANPSGEFTVEIFRSDGERLVVGKAPDGTWIMQHSLPHLSNPMQERLEKAFAQVMEDPAFRPR